MSILKEVWVFAERPEILAELCNGAHQLGETITAVVVGPKSTAEQAAVSGADKVYWLGEIDSGKMLEDFTLTIYNLLKENQPALVLVGASKRSKLVAGRLAAKLGTSVLADVTALAVEGDRLQAQRMMYGGAAFRTARSNSPTVIATIGSGVLTASAYKPDQAGSIQGVDFIAAPQRIKCREKLPKQAVSVNLGAAKRIVSVGRGIAQQEDLKMIGELASLLGAEMGCTRPIAEEEKWMPKELYIGVSGVMQLKPEMYVAIGISGQVQHMIGCNQSRTVFAINSDKNSPIFKQCDYGIVGDLYKIVPILIDKIKAV